MKTGFTKRKIQAEETKKRIIGAAKQLLQEQSLENVSVDSVVEAAGVSKGAFYVHFESKDALSAILINEYVTEVDLDYQAYLETLDAAAPISDILMGLTGKIADVITGTIGCDNIKILYKAHLTKTIDSDSALSYGRDLYKMFAEMLEKGVRQGEFRADIPVDTLARHCVLALRGLTFEWCIRYPDFNLKEQCLIHFEILLKGIRK